MFNGTSAKAPPEVEKLKMDEMIRLQYEAMSDLNRKFCYELSEANRLKGRNRMRQARKFLREHKEPMQIATLAYNKALLADRGEA